MTPDPAQAATYELPRGTAVGKYEILRRLAVGGMAEIYLARSTGQAGFEKLVVLKRILPNVAADPTFVQMFLEEARLAATLHHANIADVYDVGEDKGTYFFTMEYVHGQDVRVLRHETQKRAEPIPLAIGVTIIHGAASALEHAHELKGPDGQLVGLVHRDVSASNVMVSYDGAVKLLDFGIARASTNSHKTQTGTLKGKIPYMSPEQCKGHPLDRRSDLFSLGVVLYELTVGRRPFRGESDFAIMDQIVYKGALPPSQMVRGYPPELEAIVMKLLDRDARQRYPTASDMLHELDEFVARHGLWLSPRAVGKYMRTLFADRIAAWEQAEQQGVPFAQHVAQSITSQSQRSELMTPPSQLMRPPITVSQELRAQRPLEPPPEPIGTMDPLPVLRPGPPSAALPVASYPAAKPSSSRTLFYLIAAALVLGAGGVIGYVVSQTAKTQAAEKQGEPATPAEERKAMPMVESKPAEVKPAEVKPAEVKPAEAKPAEVKPAEAKRAEAKPAEVKPAADVKPAVNKPDDTKPAQPKPKPRPRPKQTDKENPSWDPNSPFLPQ